MNIATQNNSKEVLQDIEDIEIDLLIYAILKRYGYDFRNYSKHSRKRRIKSFLAETGYSTISEMLSQLLYDSTFFTKLISTLSVNVTEMFRDPDVYKTLCERIIPLLRTYPYINIWHAGCASGEEVYSLAIVLKEAGLYERCQIYATDFNDSVINKAKEGIYSIDQLKTYTYNYQKAGGKRSLSDYFYSNYDNVIINRELKENILFANHNLVSDKQFAEMHLIFCRNVLIYFNKHLKNRVLKLLTNSLVYNGYLCLGSKESISFTEISKYYIEVANREKIFQKKRVSFKN